MENVVAREHGHMHIVVLNGSPKGETSVTMQYVRFLEKHFPLHEFEILSVAADIRKLENDAAAFEQTLRAIAGADAILWAFPLYYMLVHASYKRFIEMVSASESARAAIQGKYTATLSTSIKFFDYTAHNYIQGICDDLGLRFCGSFSAHMTDLFSEANQKRLVAFGQDFFTMIENREPVSRVYPAIDASICPPYRSGEVKIKTPLAGRKAVIVTDSMEPGTNLNPMIRHFQKSFEPEADIIDLSTLSMRGGCLGCMHCGFDNICVYDGHDDVRPAYERMMTYDILIYAGTIRDRYLSSLWKQFYDRRFFNTHRPMFIGKQFAFCLSGPLRQIPNLRLILESLVQLDGSNVSGFVTDETDAAGDEVSDVLDARIEAAAARLARQAELHYIQPMQAPALTGLMVFRDHVWSQLRLVFQGDHRYYRSHKMYDFPQKKWKTRLYNTTLIPLSKLPPVKRYIQKEMKNLMIRGYQNLKGKDEL